MQVFDTLRLVLTTPLSDVEVGQSTGLSRATVRRYRRLADQKQFMWSDLAELGPTAVRDLFNRKAGRPTLPAPDLALMAAQLQAKGTTLQLLWEDYRRTDPHNTLSYSQLAARLKGFRDTQPSSMRQHHRPGERVFVDYSGLRPYYFDRTTQKKTFVELFVGVLGASSFIYATCTPSQKVPDFIKAHVGMLDYFGGVPMVVVPDNLKSAVVKTGKTPTIQRAYADYARHYSMAVVPARPYKPKDKAVAEASVKVVQQRIVARMQSQRFYSLEEVNVAVALFLDELNNRPMVKDGQSRRARFDALERPALRPLPEQPYEYAEWLPVPTVPRDYHVAIDGHFYSVPHRLVGQRVDARVLDAAIELFHEHHLVARHSRSHVTGAHTTIAGHQPDAHRAQAERTPDGMVAWSKESGAHIHRFIKAQLDRAQPYLGLPACDTVKRLAERHGTEAINRACQSALELRTPTVSALRRLVSTATTSVKTEPRSSNARSARAIRQGVRHAD